LGTFSKPFLDFTQISVIGGGTLQSGASPFEFDSIVDFGTLGLGITQQIVGPLMFSTGVNLNVDPGSAYYGEVIDSNFELRWQRRSYEIGLYFNPYEGIGGVRFRLNDFKFKIVDSLFKNPGVYWYHSHVNSKVQVDLGLQGVLIVDYPSEPFYYDYDNIIVLDDVKLNVQGEHYPFGSGMEVMHGRFGNVFLINGNSSQKIGVFNNSILRLRIVNTANARTFNFNIEGKKLFVIGKDIGKSDWIVIDQNRIQQFADATSDHQWIHLDTERASKELPTKSTIAHGFLTLSLIVPLSSMIWTITGTKMTINYGLNKVRFINMVPVDSKVRLSLKVQEVNKLDNGGTQLISEATLEIEGHDKPAYVAESIMVAFA
jgi:acyl dehydratase